VDIFFDTTILVAAPSKAIHTTRRPDLRCCASPPGRTRIYGPASIAEVFAALTRLPIQPRIHPVEAAGIVTENILPHLEVVPLNKRTKQMKTQPKRRSVKVQEGSGNVFADIGMAKPEEALAKAEIALSVTDMIAKRGLTQLQAGRLLNISQPRVSDLVQGRLVKFLFGQSSDLCPASRTPRRDSDVNIEKTRSHRESGVTRGGLFSPSGSPQTPTSQPPAGRRA
jgi:predicted XRE-type DNA-binding protein